MRIREGKKVKVAFTKGHGEPRPDDPRAMDSATGRPG